MQNIFPYQKIESCQSGANSSFPLIKKETKSDFFRAVRRQPQKEKDVCHITFQAMRCLIVVKYAEGLPLANMGERSEGQIRC